MLLLFESDALMYDNVALMRLIISFDATSILSKLFWMDVLYSCFSLLCMLFISGVVVVVVVVFVKDGVWVKVYVMGISDSVLCVLIFIIHDGYV